MNKNYKHFNFIDNLKRFRGTIHAIKQKPPRLRNNERVFDFDIKFIKILKKKLNLIILLHIQR